MKKILALILAVFMCLSLCACGGGKGENSESVEDKVRSSVESRLMTYVTLSYETVGVPTITCYIEEVGENVFEVSGKVTVKDKYGDTYSGKYDAEVEYDPSTDKCDVDYDLGKLYKD